MTTPESPNRLENFRKQFAERYSLLAQAVLRLLTPDLPDDYDKLPELKFVEYTKETLPPEFVTEQMKAKEILGKYLECDPLMLVSWKPKGFISPNLPGLDLVQEGFFQMPGESYYLKQVDSGYPGIALYFMIKDVDLQTQLSPEVSTSYVIPNVLFCKILSR